MSIRERKGLHTNHFKLNIRCPSCVTVLCALRESPWDGFPSLRQATAAPPAWEQALEGRPWCYCSPACPLSQPPEQWQPAKPAPPPLTPLYLLDLSSPSLIERQRHLLVHLIFSAWTTTANFQCFLCWSSYKAPQGSPATQDDSACNLSNQEESL